MTPPALPQPPARFESYFAHPWRWRARHSMAFRRWLWDNGWLSPHFRRSEGKCKDGTPIPASLRYNAQRQAFKLERFRHRIGDRPLPVLSWYRTPSYNRQIGGARYSRHMSADACDFSRETVERIGRSRFQAAAKAIYWNGGVGTYPPGSMHLDARGYHAEWTSY